MLNPSDINATIAARETEVERLRRDLKIAEAKLRGMKELRDQIPGKVPDSVIGKAFQHRGDTGRFDVNGSKVKSVLPWRSSTGGDFSFYPCPTLFL